jgi:hypothetical protein
MANTGSNRNVWFAVVLPRLEIGFPLEVPSEERHSYRNWVRRRRQTLVGEYTSRSLASKPRNVGCLYIAATI